MIVQNCGLKTLLVRIIRKLLRTIYLRKFPHITIQEELYHV